MRISLLCLLLFIPSLAFAAGAFHVAPTDKSMEYLGMIFGTVPGTPIAKPDAMFGNLMYIFNQTVFALGIIVIIYTTFIGTLNTAQEGQFLGSNKWHPIIVPARAAAGIYLLLPTATGYNWIQILVMWFIVQGVGAANAIWSLALTGDVTAGSTSTSVNSTRDVEFANAEETVNSIFNSVVCMERINSDAYAGSVNLIEPVTLYRYNDKMNFGLQSNAGAAGEAGQYENICGSINLPSIGGGLFSNANSTEVEQRKNMLETAITTIANDMAPEAQSALAGNSVSSAIFEQSVDKLNNLAQQMTTTFPTVQQFNQASQGEGWIHAGSYYFELVQGKNITDMAVSVGATGMDSAAVNNIFGTTYGSQVQNEVSNTSNNATSSQSSSSGGSSGELQFNTEAQSAEVSSLINTVFGSMFESLVQDIEKHMTTANDDPIVSMASFGTLIVNITEITFWAALGLIFGAWLLTSPMSCINPLGHAMDYLLAIFMPVAGIIITLLYLEGLTLALYVPLIPYLVFTFAALTWFILVIEAMLGAPLIGLQLIVPSEDEIGKAGQAMVILLGLFLRPALMIVGFIFAIKLLSVAIGILNFGFWSTLIASTGASSGIGIFGLIAVIFMYVAIAVGLVHEAFSLIYQLPNKVLRWMGGGPEGDEAGSHVKELKGSVQKGGGYSKSIMTSTMTKFSGK